MLRTWLRGIRRDYLSSPCRRPSPGRRGARFCPRIDVLEARDLPSTFFVTTATDSGPGSLRAALLSANGNASPSTIDFNIDSGIQRIHLQSALPVMNSPVTLDGSTQGGFAGSPLTFAGPAVDGLTLTGGTSTVRDLVIHGFDGSGIVLAGPGGDSIVGDYIGTDVTGSLAFSNHQRGIFINGSSNNTIGGAAPGTGNVISENGWTGILIANSASDVIQGNKIGTDAGGTQPLGNNGFGIRIVNGTSIAIGGTTAQARNVISANAHSGVFLGVGATGNLLQGNYIGTNVNGSQPLGNLERGVEISSASSNTIGGTTAGAGNVISGNHWAGLFLHAGSSDCLVEHNLIGTDASGSQGLGNGGAGIRMSAANGNTIGGTALGARNVISGNGMSGLELGDGCNSNQVQGNYIGSDVSGANALGNSERGIRISDAANNEIGGTAVGSGNVISGNAMAGVLMEEGATGNQVQGNFIGTDRTGAKALANGASGVGISGSSSNQIGGTAAGAANVISGNDKDGVHLDEGAFNNILQGNFIGTNLAGSNNLGNNRNGVSIGNGANNIIGGSANGAGNKIANNFENGVRVDGSGALSNTIIANAIYGNNHGGILLANGGNGMAGAPTVGAVVVFGNTAMVEGALAAGASGTYVLDFYGNTSADPSGHEEGEIFLGSIQVTTNAQGIAFFNVSLDVTASGGQAITATATDALGDTSAFSTTPPSPQAVMI